MTTINEQKQKTRAATMRLLAPNIVETSIHESILLDVGDLLEIKRINNQLTKGFPYGVLVDPGARSSVTKEGRHLSASAEYQQQTKAVAMIMRYPHHGIIFRFYVKLNKPKTKIQLFSKRDEAIEWLKKQLA